MSKQVGKRVKKLRDRGFLNQGQIATILGLSRSSIANIERGAQNLTSENVIKICKEFKVSADWLLGLRKIKENKDGNRE